MSEDKKTDKGVVADFGSSNVFTIVLNKILSANDQLILSNFLPPSVDQSRVTVELPKDLSHGDLASNNAIVLARTAKKSPVEIANASAELLRADPFFADVTVAGPGFQNFIISRSALCKFLSAAVRDPSSYGRSNIGRGMPVNVEYVSANPTGPMHVGHGRGAVFGDVLANILAFTGFQVTREYYINDAGSQVDQLARSAFLRYREALGEAIGDIPDGLYPGDYLKPVGELIAARYKTELLIEPEHVWLPLVRQVAIECMLVRILTDLEVLNVNFDVFFSEKALSERVIKFSPQDQRPIFYCAQSSYDLMEGGPGGIRYYLAKQKLRDAQAQGKQETSGVFTAELVPGELGKPNYLEATLHLLNQKGLIYTGRLPRPKGGPVEGWEDRDQTLFRSKEFGDVSDRALKKPDGSYTYFASDIAYHRSKLDRGFRALVDVWGADHGGYLKRMQAAVAALSDRIADLDVKVVQLVKLLRAGEPVKMSKRAGEFVTLRDVVDEVGRDAVRFMMLFRKNDAMLDFDLAKVIEQSRDNPVFYVQYGHARGQSVLRNVRGTFQGLPMDLTELAETANLDLLSDETELALMRQVTLYPRVVESASTAHEPHRIAFYLYDLASDFHALWTLGNASPHLRFIIHNDRQMTMARLVLVQGVVTVLASGLALLGVGAPNEM